MNKKRKIITLIICALSLLLLISLHYRVQENDHSVQNEITVEKYLENSDEEWFLTGKKEYKVKAMMVSKETSFHNEYENVDYVVTDDNETVILKGVVDEMWAFKLSKVMQTYVKPDGSEIKASDFTQKDVYIDLITKADPNSNFAMFVPVDINVSVETAWGDILHTNVPEVPHGKGDFLVCRIGEDNNPDLTDVWVLNGTIFPETYDMSNYNK